MMNFTAKFRGGLIGAVSLLVFGCGTLEPEPIERKDFVEQIKTDLDLIYKINEPVLGKVTLSEAMARALKFNLDNRIKLMESVLADKSFELVKKEMLPQLAASAGYIRRSNVNGSRSLSLLSGNESLEPSTSQDQARRVRDIRFTWNLLDFGVSYYQAKQDADRFLISKEAREDVMLKLLSQVRTAYWRTAVLQYLSDDINKIHGRARQALNDLRQVHKENLRTPINVLNDMRVLIEITQQMEQMQHTVNAAEIELAALINVAPGTKLDLELPKDFTAPPRVPEDLDALELTALANSGEYVSQAYTARVDQLESRKAMIQMWPGLEFAYSGNYDSNSYVVNNTWGEMSLRLTWDIMRLFKYQQYKEHNQAREALSLARRLAINMAVVAKVHLSWQEHRNTLKRLANAKELDDVDKQISQSTRNRSSSKAGSGVKTIQNDVRAFRSHMGYMLAYADAQDSYGAFVNSLGLNPIPEAYHELTVGQLATELRHHFTRWDQGEFEAPAETQNANVLMPMHNYYVNHRQAMMRANAVNLLQAARISKPVPMQDVLSATTGMECRLSLDCQSTP